MISLPKDTFCKLSSRGAISITTFHPNDLIIVKQKRVAERLVRTACGLPALLYFVYSYNKFCLLANAIMMIVLIVDTGWRIAGSH